MEFVYFFLFRALFLLLPSWLRVQTHRQWRVSFWYLSWLLLSLIQNWLIFVNRNTLLIDNTLQIEIDHPLFPITFVFFQSWPIELSLLLSRREQKLNLFFRLIARLSSRVKIRTYGSINFYRWEVFLAEAPIITIQGPPVIWTNILNRLILFCD